MSNRYVTFLLFGVASVLPASLITTACADDRSKADANRVTVTETDDSILIRLDTKPVLRYNKTNTNPPVGVESLFARSGYIHPVYSPSGRVVTDEYPADHPHQSGLFHAWVSTEFRGQPVDFWNKAKQKGCVSHEKVLSTTPGRDAGGFRVSLLHEDITEPERPIAVIREFWDVGVHDDETGCFVIDLTSTQTCIASSPLLINQYHYGGMALRGAQQWYNDASAAAYQSYHRAIRKGIETDPPGIDVMKHDFVTSEGLGRFDGNHTRPRWVDMYGSIEGEPAGIAMMSHGTNFRSPQPVRLHPKKPYFCFSPPVLGDFRIEPGQSYVSRYRFVVHDGEPKIDLLDKLYKQFNAEDGSTPIGQRRDNASSIESENLNPHP